VAQGFNTSGLKAPFGIFSHAAWAPAGRTLYISGQVSQDSEGKVVGEGDIAAQTEQTLRNIGAILDSAGGSFDARVVDQIVDSIVPLFDSGVHEGHPYYVMPNIEGETLRARLRRERRIPLEETVRLSGEIADALAYAHGRGLVHEVDAQGEPGGDQGDRAADRGEEGDEAEQARDGRDALQDARDGLEEVDVVVDPLLDGVPGVREPAVVLDAEVVRVVEAVEGGILGGLAALAQVLDLAAERLLAALGVVDGLVE